jgi:hypothetical protein
MRFSYSAVDSVPLNKGETNKLVTLFSNLQKVINLVGFDFVV